jgi:outer membrane protein assembly factor BamB
MAPADYLVTTFASVTYQDQVGASYYKDSNQASCRVKQVFGLSATVDTNWLSQQDGVAVDIPCSLTNTGNGLDTFTVNLQAPPKWWNGYVILDANGDGIRQSTEWTPFDDSGLMDYGQSQRFFVRLETPYSNRTTDGVMSQLTIASTKGGGDVGSMSSAVFNQLIVVGRHASTWDSWNYPTDSPLAYNAAGDPQRVWYTGTDGKIYMAKLNPWQGSYDKIVTPNDYLGLPAITIDRLMWVTSMGYCVTIDPSSKSIIKTVSAPNGARFLASPAPYTNKAFVVSTGGRIHIISREGLVTQSSVPINREITTSPVVVGTNVIVGTTKGELYAFDISSLNVSWIAAVDLSTSLIGIPALGTDGKSLVLASANNRVYSFSISSRSLRWMNQLDSAIVGQATAGRSGAFFLTSGRKLYGLDIYTGTDVPGYPFIVPGSQPLSGGMVVATRSESGAQPYLWFGTPEGKVYAVCAWLGLTYWTADLSVEQAYFYGAPALAGGKITFSATKGWGYGFDPE